MTIELGDDKYWENIQVTRPFCLFVMIAVVVLLSGCGDSHVASVSSQVLSSVSLPTRSGSIALMCSSGDGIVVGAEKMLIGLSPSGEIAWVRPLAEWPTHLAAAPSGKTVAVTRSGEEVLVGDTVRTDAPMRSLVSYRPHSIHAITWLDDVELAVAGDFGCDIINIQSGDRTNIVTGWVQDVYVNMDAGSFLMLSRDVLTSLDLRSRKRRSVAIPTRSDSKIVGMFKHKVFIVEFGFAGHFSMKPKPAYVWTIDTDATSVSRSKNATENFRTAQLTSGPIVTLLANEPIIWVDWYDEIVAINPVSGLTVGKLPSLSGPLAVTDYSTSVVWAVRGNSVLRIKFRLP